jgi:hypothetical protein
MTDKEVKPWRIPLHFETIEEMESFFRREGPDIGFFQDSNYPPGMGHRASIVVTVDALKNPLPLEGRVLWRRMKSGKGVLAGAFIGLVDRDRERLSAILDYLSFGAFRAERRSHVRYPAFLKATCLTDTGKFSTETLNLSERGAFLSCYGLPPEKGEHFPMTIFFESGAERSVMMNARVAWSSRIANRYCMGVEFLADQPQRNEYQRSLESIESGWTQG